MAKSNAERQAAYREKHLKHENGTKERLNMLVSIQAKAKLERIAICYGVTRAEVVERLLIQEEDSILEKMSTTESREYYNKGECIKTVTA